MKKLSMLAQATCFATCFAASFALATTGAMAQTSLKPADTKTPAAHDAMKKDEMQKNEMNKSGANSGANSGAMKSNQMGTTGSNAGANAVDMQRGTQEPAKAGGVANPAAKTAPGATKQAN